MKTRLMKKVGIAAVPLTIGCAMLLSFKPTVQNASVFDVLAGVPVVELPETAARLVAQASAANKAAVMGEVLRASAALARPEVLAYMVSAICKSSPEIAGLTVETSVSLQPGEILPITKAALAAAPNSVESIVASGCRVAPRSYIAVAQMANAEVPQARERILRGVITAMPSMNGYVERARSYASHDSILDLLNKAQELAVNAIGEESASARIQSQSPLATVELAQTTTRSAVDIDQMAAQHPVLFAQAQAAPSVFMPVPTIGPPYTPPSTNMNTLTLGDTKVVIPGSGRDYSAP